MIIDIRGTNGSGKSFIVRRLLQVYGSKEVVIDGKTVGYYLKKRSVCVLGRYTDTGGGCDGFKGGVRQVEELVRSLYKSRDHLVLEGIMVSHLFSRFDSLAKGLGVYKFMFLTTPLDVCIKRVVERRLARGNTKPFDPGRNLIKDYHRTRERVYGRLKAAGHDVELLSYRRPLARVKGLIRR